MTSNNNLIFFSNSIYNTPAEVLYIVFLNKISIMLQFRDFLQIRKINVTDTICTMRTVRRVFHL